MALLCSEQGQDSTEKKLRACDIYGESEMVELEGVWASLLQSYAFYQVLQQAQHVTCVSQLSSCQVSKSKVTSSPPYNHS
jgi:hypothetical protein